jgi:endoglucanase
MPRTYCRRRTRMLLGLAALLSGLDPLLASDSEPLDAFAYNRLLAGGVNFGNSLESPQEGEWGFKLEEGFFEAVRRAGFQSVRIPIRWSAHAATESPYGIDESFFKRIDWAIEQSISRGLVVVINMHHYEEIFQHPDEHRTRFLALWQQIAERYQKASDHVFFELLNEPHDKLDAQRWNRLAGEGLAVVRKTNPRRIVIIGPVQWNSIAELPNLELPDDRWLIATVHYYSPFEFTHQGAEWMPESKPWIGKRWTGSDAERQAVERDFDAAAEWGKKHNRPIYLGEFGAYGKADTESRVRWTRYVRQSAEARGFSWAYWEFGAGFGIYDRDAKKWREPLLAALVERSAESKTVTGPATKP